MDRGDLLVTLLLRLEAILADPSTPALLERWHHLATTLGRDVRVELASGAVIVGRAVALTDGGRLVVETADGARGDHRRRRAPPPPRLTSGRGRPEQRVQLGGWAWNWATASAGAARAPSTRTGVTSER